MSLSLFSFQGETPNLCARKPYPRLYTGRGREEGRGHGGDRVSTQIIEQETESERGKYSREARGLVHRRESGFVADSLSMTG